jgi:hypothetical protein
MPFPQTIKEMLDQGYKLSNRAECRACGADIEWWSTPHGKKLPVNYGTAIAHWATCPQAALFRVRRED